MNMNNCFCFKQHHHHHHHAPAAAHQRMFLYSPSSSLMMGRGTRGVCKSNRLSEGYVSGSSFEKKVAATTAIFGDITSRRDISLIKSNRNKLTVAVDVDEGMHYTMFIRFSIVLLNC